MLELMIERWSDPARGDSYRWSLWDSGKRIAMGGPHRSVDESEREALGVCGKKLGRQPDRVTRL